MSYFRFSFLIFFVSCLFASESPGLRVDMKRVETLMENGFNQSHIEKIQSSDEVVLFLGNTQIGKSTLINSLLGCDYESDRNRKTRIVLRPGSKAEFTKRSDLGTTSTTLYPEVHRSDISPYFFVIRKGLVIRVEKKKL